MKTIYFLSVFISLCCYGPARGQNSTSIENPFEKFDYGETKIATLSQGKYAEFHDKKHIVKIGFSCTIPNQKKSRLFSSLKKQKILKLLTKLKSPAGLCPLIRFLGNMPTTRLMLLVRIG